MDAAPSDAHTAPLSQAYGYGIVVGLGFLFSLGMILTTWILKRYQGEQQTSEMFSTAGRTVKSGLVSSAVVSSWTWAATLLQSSGVAYRYGVSGPFWVLHLFRIKRDPLLTLSSMHQALPCRFFSSPLLPLSSSAVLRMPILFSKSFEPAMDQQHTLYSTHLILSCCSVPADSLVPALSLA